MSDPRVHKMSHLQNFRLLDPPRHILPGDQVILECIYDTSKTNKTIYVSLGLPY